MSAIPAPHPGASRPNILFLLSDQHHPRTLSPAGHPVVRTPHLQRMADEGVTFEHAYCPTPLCVPSRVSTLVSRFSHATGVVKNLYEDLIGDQPNFVRHLRAAGYHTGHIGKSHLATGSSGRERFDRLGFCESLVTTGKNGVAAAGPDDAYVRYLRDRGVLEAHVRDLRRRIEARGETLADAHPSVLDVEDYFDHWVSRQVADWLTGYAGNAPFLLMVNWPGPHALRDAPGPYAQLYDRAKIDPPIEDPMEGAPQALKKRQQEVQSRMPGEGWRDIRASYYGMVSLIDHGIGMMLGALEERGALDNTVIVYAADHGEMLCDHGLVYKTCFYEASVGVPLLVRYPRRFPRGLRPRSLVSLVDLAPTLLELAGAGTLPRPHGASLVPILAGEKDDRDEVFSEFQDTRMVRRGPWKYVCDPDWDVPQLFHLEDDPSELRNLAREMPEKARELHTRIETWLAETSV